tara:strand:+ start:70 stop:270 length:201 start_codon:yes stop_codon:yes gene_type:complete
VLSIGRLKRFENSTTKIAQLFWHGITWKSLWLNFLDANKRFTRVLFGNSLNNEVINIRLSEKPSSG